MLRDVEVHDTAPLMPQHQEHVEHAEGHRGHDEEVDGDDLADMVLQESAPSLRGRLGLPAHVLGDGGLSQVVAQEGKFGLNTRGSPERVLQAHTSD